MFMQNRGRGRGQFRGNSDFVRIKRQTIVDKRFSNETEPSVLADEPLWYPPPQTTNGNRYGVS